MNVNLKISSSIKCDVLIIGAGGGGLRCASEILEKAPNTKVLAVTKVAHCEKSHTSTAQGGLSAVDPNDTVDSTIYQMFDTWKGSDCSADQNVIEKIINEAWEQIVWLEKKGMHFTRNEKGEFSRRHFGGHTVRFGEGPAHRAVFEADRSGKGMIDAAWGVAVKNNCSFMNQSVVTELIFKENRCIGAILYNYKLGQFLPVFAKATVISTGGCGQVFQITTNCRQNTGDGLAVISQCGLPLMDMEAIQFHPTGILGPGICASETLRTVGGILRNKDLEPFMEKYAPKMKDLAPRDLVSRAIETEIAEGRGILNPDYGINHVWLDLTHLPAKVHDEQVPEVEGFFKKFVNIDPKTDLCPVRPSVHYQMGGIPTNEFGEVLRNSGEKIPGLFALGECATASFQGFNRLGSHSLLELITMGKFVGDRIIEQLEPGQNEVLENVGDITLEKFSKYLEGSKKVNLGNIQEKMQAVMTEKVGVFRTKNQLLNAIEKLKEYYETIQDSYISNNTLIFNPEIIQRWEIENLLTVSMIIAQGALNREESRGAHARVDFPNRREEFNFHTLAKMSDYGKVTIDKRPINMSLFESNFKHFEKFNYIERKY